MHSTAGAEEEVPVLIVGGGGAGLTSSMLLARLGVEHLLVSARPGTSDLPKAHVLNQRAMEVLDDVGVAGAIARRGTPAEQMAATAFYAGLAGPGPDYGRRLARLESWGAGGADENWRAASPWRQQNLPQIRLEPLLKARAEELSPAGSASAMSSPAWSKTARACGPPSARAPPAATTRCAAGT
jgi:2,4-dichlorophenol 6-monooxygenase